MSSKGTGKGGAGKKGGFHNVENVNKPSLRRLARRAGVKRIDGGLYQKLREVLKEHLSKVVQESIYFSQNRDPVKGKILLSDVVNGVFAATGKHLTYLEATYVNK